MSRISSKHEKRQSFLHPDLALVFMMLIGILAISGSFTGTLLDTGNAAGSSSNVESTSFTSDEQYWDANCSHGWSSDSMCDDIVSRARMCARDLPTAYCSDYSLYMQEFYNRMINKYKSL